jgi:hypothetical protein
MATRTGVEVTDDIDASNADETVTFALQGTTYEIDLSKKNFEKLVKAMEPYTTNGRKTGGQRPSSGRTTGRGDDRDRMAKMREWARAKGFQVSDRGRIPAAVQEAYQNATA